MIVDGEYFGGLVPESAVKILQRIAAGEKITGETVGSGKPAQQKKASRSEQK
jgi:hypothetical protein